MIALMGTYSPLGYGQKTQLSPGFTRGSVTLLVRMVTVHSWGKPTVGQPRGVAHTEGVTVGVSQR